MNTTMPKFSVQRARSESSPDIIVFDEFPELPFSLGESKFSDDVDSDTLNLVVTYHKETPTDADRGRFDALIQDLVVTALTEVIKNKFDD